MTLLDCSLVKSLLGDQQKNKKTKKPGKLILFDDDELGCWGFSVTQRLAMSDTVEKAASGLWP